MLFQTIAMKNDLYLAQATILRGEIEMPMEVKCVEGWEVELIELWNMKLFNLDFGSTDSRIYLGLEFISWMEFGEAGPAKGSAVSARDQPVFGWLAKK